MCVYIYIYSVNTVCVCVCVCMATVENSSSHLVLNRVHTAPYRLLWIFAGSFLVCWKMGMRAAACVYRPWAKNINIFQHVRQSPWDSIRKEPLVYNDLNLEQLDIQRESVFARLWYKLTILASYSDICLWTFFAPWLFAEFPPHLISPNTNIPFSNCKHLITSLGHK